MTRYKFITFEGCEGSGKTTQSRLLHNYLVTNNKHAILTREIGGTVVAEEIRDIMLHKKMHPMSELLLIMAARNEHILNVIHPALSSGHIVICDRFIDSTMSYQGIEIGVDVVIKLHHDILNYVMPDLTFFINTPPEIGLKRAILRGDGNKFEQCALDFHNKVYKQFKRLTQTFPERIVEIDGMQDTDVIHSQIISYLEST